MRQLILVVVLVAASFLGGAFVNGPGLQWAQTRVLRSLGLNNGGEITSVDLKSTASSEANADRSVPSHAGSRRHAGVTGPQCQPFSRKTNRANMIRLIVLPAFRLGESPSPTTCRHLAPSRHLPYHRQSRPGQALANLPTTASIPSDPGVTPASRCRFPPPTDTVSLSPRSLHQPLSDSLAALLPSNPSIF